MQGSMARIDTNCTERQEANGIECMDQRIATREKRITGQLELSDNGCSVVLNPADVGHGMRHLLAIPNTCSLQLIQSNLTCSMHNLRGAF